MTKPTIKTLSILTKGCYYDEDSGRWIDDLDEGQHIFEHVVDQYEDDECRLVVLRNKETNELWGVSTWYNGASWDDEAFLHDEENDIRTVTAKEVTVTKYEFAE